MGEIKTNVDKKNVNYNAKNVSSVNSIGRMSTQQEMILAEREKTAAVETMVLDAALEPAKIPMDKRMDYLFPDGIPKTQSELEKYMVSVDIVITDKSGKTRTVAIKVHEKLAGTYQAIFKELNKAGYVVEPGKINGSDYMNAYEYRPMRNSSSLSHHSYGSAIDINVPENPYIVNGKNQTGGAWKPGENPLSIEPDGIVVKTFDKYGFEWGGNWQNSKDYMHFTYTGG